MRILLALAACVAMVPAASGGVPLVTDHVLINEISANAPGSSEQGFEWFELYNPGVLDADVSAWIVTDLDTCNFRPGAWTLPAGTIVPALGTLNLTIPAASGICLANGGDDLTIRTPDGADVDAVWYGSGSDYGAVNAALPAPEGSSLARCHLVAPTGLAFDQDAPADEFYVDSNPTPGAQNRPCTPSL